LAVALCAKSQRKEARAALVPQAASAGSLHDGDFGGTWVYIAPSDHYHWRYAEPAYERPLLVAPSYAYVPDYDPELVAPLPYEDGPGIAVAGPDVAVAVEVD
jgi:hypothetical protein